MRPAAVVVCAALTFHQPWWLKTFTVGHHLIDGHHLFCPHGGRVGRLGLFALGNGKRDVQLAGKPNLRHAGFAGAIKFWALELKIELQLDWLYTHTADEFGCSI